MKIIDLTEKYQSHYIQEGNCRAYRDSFPELFDHYYKFWVTPDTDIVKVGGKEIQTRKRWMNQHLEHLKSRLAKEDIDPDAINIVYFIGAGTTNGHAFEHEKEFHVWLPLETYTTEILVQIFVTHEIAHALHYHHCRSFYFDTEEQKLHFARQLITEGLATYLTRELLQVSDNESLWADFLNKADSDTWWRQCEREGRNIYQLIYDNYSKSDRRLGIFYANDPDDIYRYRAGYFAGLKLIDDYAKRDDLSVKDLLNLPRDIFESDLFSLLSEYIHR